MNPKVKGNAQEAALSSLNREFQLVPQLQSGTAYCSDRGPTLCYFTKSKFYLEAHQQPYHSQHRNLQKDPLLYQISGDLLNCTKAICRVYYPVSKLGKKRISRANPDPSTRHNEFNNNFQSTTSASATSSYRISIESCVHH